MNQPLSPKDHFVPASSTPAISIADISKTYASGFQALKKINKGQAPLIAELLGQVR